MKVLLAFRGGFSRIQPKYLCKNIRDKIFAPLEANGIDYTTVFFTNTYDASKCDALKEGLKPESIYMTQDGQLNNFNQAINTIVSTYTTYDYIVFLRFELIYKIDILRWNIFQEGFVVPYKENCPLVFSVSNLYSDTIICISKDYVERVKTVYSNFFMKEHLHGESLHDFVTWLQLYDKSIPIHCMLDGFYQSNTGLEAGDDRINPLYIMSHFKYLAYDRDQYIEYLPEDQNTYPLSYQPRYTSQNIHHLEYMFRKRMIQLNRLQKAYTAVIIETRQHKALEFVLRNFMETLPEQWSFLVFCGNLNKEFCEAILARLPRKARLIHMAVDTMRASEYSTLLCKHRRVYDEIPTETFLLFQTDTMLFPRYKENLTEFLQYDYVGAPWNNDRFGGVGNGGLSLRKKSKMLEIMDTVTYCGEPEDIYFCNNLLVDLYRPTMEQAKRFSVEEVFHPTSFGCHQPWERGFDTELLQAYPEVKTLFELNGIVPQA